MIGSQDVTLRPQETSMWCWAASGEMIMDFMGRDGANATKQTKDSAVRIAAIIPCRPHASIAFGRNLISITSNLKPPSAHP